MDFSIMFFSSQDRSHAVEKYSLLKEVARFTDAHGFEAIWTPERHFHEFGGLFPNPSTTSAAIAMITKNIKIRGGSVVSPLHHAIRIAEEWSVVDNLSGGRAGIAFGSGWNANDFIFFPDRYQRRREIMYEQIALIHRLWRGEAVSVRNSSDVEIDVKIFPRPVQRILPVWLTASGTSQGTFIHAGRIGANVLTSLIFQNIEELSSRIASYRNALTQNGHDHAKGRVTLMLHTYVGDSDEGVIDRVRMPLREYLRSAVRLENTSAETSGHISGGLQAPPQEIPADIMEELLDITFERYSQTAAILGTVISCQQRIRDLQRAGVNEIACLIDFGLTEQEVMGGLEYLNLLQRQCNEAAGVSTVTAGGP